MCILVVNENENKGYVEQKMAITTTIQRVADARQSESILSKEHSYGAAKTRPLHLSLVPSSDTMSCESCSPRYYSMYEISRHNTEESAWLVAGDEIYDATFYLNQHPGGRTSILRKAGGACDCTEDFEFHSKKGRKLWQKYKIGMVKRYPGQEGYVDRQWWMFWI